MDMADDFFQGGESWWINSTRSIFSLSSSSSIGQYFSCPVSDLLLDMKTRYGDDYNSCSDDSILLQELPKDQILGIGFSSSPSPDWNQSLHEKLDSSYPSMLQEEVNSSLNCSKLKRNFSTITEDSSSNSIAKPIVKQDFTYYSDLLQTLFDTDLQEPQQSLSANNQAINCASSFTNHGQNLNDFAPSLPKSNIEEIRESTSSTLTKNSSNEPPYKRPRIETPSPLPTFKVRKEKMGDRITALQQLVSPFGKTDTASVLQEAIEYINFLHDQVNALSTPYSKNGSPTQHQQVKEQGGLAQGLRSKGLCLVPISSTFPVAAETTVNFWTPTLGGTFT